MEKGCTTQESAPPYPDPPEYGAAMPLIEMNPQPAFAPHAAGPPPYQGGPFTAAPVASAPTVTYRAVNPPLRDISGPAVCNHCQQNVLTMTEAKSGLLTWAVCGGLALFGCWICCCIPFCIDSLKDVEHRCPSCHNTIHIHKQL